MKPLVTVVVPVYNAQKYLSHCLDSIIAQNFESMEIILVNDGSTDASEEIINAYQSKYPFIRYIKQKNKGAAAARNAGIKEADGDYISFIDADDYIDLGLYQDFQEKIKDQEVDIFMFNANIISQENRTAIAFTTDFFKPGVKEGDVIDYKSIANFFYGNHSICNKIYRKDFLRQKKIWMKEGCIFEDTLFNFATLINAEKILFTYKAYYNYLNVSENSVTHTIGKNAFDLFDIALAMEETAENLGLYPYFEYALFQYEYECLIKTISQTEQKYRRKLFLEGQKFLLPRIKKLNPNIYMRLVNINYGLAFLNYSYEQFADTLLLSKSDFEFKQKNIEKPRFSIIVPMYNVERFVPLCLKSLISQTFEDFEIICVDDGSPDNSKDLIKEYAQKDSRIKLIVQENKGLGGARNTGVRAARGEYLLFVDSDDWLSLNALEKMDETIKQNPTDLGLFSFNIFIDQTMKLDPCDMLKMFENIPDVFTASQIASIMFIHLCVWNKYYRREFFIKNNLFFEENIYFEDILIHTKALIKAKSIAMCRHNLYYYRIREDSIMQSTYSDKKINDVVKALSSTIKWLKENGVYEFYRPSFARFTATALNNHFRRAGAAYSGALKSALEKDEELVALFKS